MHPTLRKILYAISFEVGGIVVGGAALTLMSDAGATRSLSLAAFGAWRGDAVVAAVQHPV